MKDWISVKNRLPDFDGTYLCFIEAPQECSNIWKYQRTVVNSMNAWILEDNETVTHWMPLPPNP